MTRMPTKFCSRHMSKRYATKYERRDQTRQRDGPRELRAPGPEGRRYYLFSADLGRGDRCSACSASGASMPISTIAKKLRSPRSIPWSPMFQRIRGTSLLVIRRAVFPSPKLEEDERGQLNGIKTGGREDTLQLRLGRRKSRNSSHSHRTRHGFVSAARSAGAPAGRGRRRHHRQHRNNQDGNRQNRSRH